MGRKCLLRQEVRKPSGHFPQTKTILAGVNVGEVSIAAIQAILNLRDTWKYLLDTLKEPLDFTYWCKLNEFIARNETLVWGELRSGTVGISDTNYLAKTPIKSKVQVELNTILSTDLNATSKALEIFTWAVLGQFFWDASKRTSMMLANKILLQAGAVMLIIKDEHLEQFNRLLLDYL